jgi:hypothetical protein
MILLPIYPGFLFIFVFMMTVGFIPVFWFYSFMWITRDRITTIGDKYQQQGDDDILNSFKISRIMRIYQLLCIFKRLE